MHQHVYVNRVSNSPCIVNIVLGPSYTSVLAIGWLLTMSVMYTLYMMFSPSYPLGGAQLRLMVRSVVPIIWTLVGGGGGTRRGDRNISV